VFTCVRWQITLCDPIWQVTLHSCVMGYVPLTAIQYLYLLFCVLCLQVICCKRLQVCSNGTRVFVHRDIWSQFVPALVARTNAMKIGNPLSEDTTVGATISREHAEKVLAYIDRAKQAVTTATV